MAVISSMKQRNMDLQIGIDRGWTQLSLDQMVGRWVKSHKSALQLMETSPDKIFLVNYSDQIGDTENTYKGISKFIGVENLFDLSSVRNNRPAIALNSEEIMFISGRVKDVAKEFDYQV